MCEFCGSGPTCAVCGRSLDFVNATVAVVRMPGGLRRRLIVANNTRIGERVRPSEGGAAGVVVSITRVDVSRG